MTQPAALIRHLVRWRQAGWRAYVFGLRAKLPPSWRRAAGRLYRPYALWRVGEPATRLLGPRYRRSRDRIDIDVTWRCNLRCFDCNRSCGQAPTEERMTVGQVRRFLNESVDRGVRWKKIGLVGGEPTLHPDFDRIVAMVLEYRDRHSPDATVKVFSNGHGREVREVLARIPPAVHLVDTRKNSRRQDHFVPFNLAPRDSDEYRGAQFVNACPSARDGGMGLSPYGYYPCCAAAGIDRIFGFDCGRKALPPDDDGMQDDLRRFCSLCGFFRLNYTIDTPAGVSLSESWRAAYAAWHAHPPALTRLPES